MGEQAAPLADVRVVEVDNYMAAPSAGAILADLGADVVKIEPLTGDPLRRISRPAKVDGMLRERALQFYVDNRGKRSAAVALDKEDGADVVRRLCQAADIFLCNLLPRRQLKFGLDPERLLAVNERLVHATLTGYGTEGPEAWRPGYDVTAFFGRSGLYDAMREGDDGLVPMARPAQGDHTAGLALVAAILAALRLVDRTGRGQVVETSLFETAVWTQASDFGVTAVDRAPVRHRAREQQVAATANRYPCGDGRWLVMNMPEPAAFARLCRAIGLDRLLADERLQTVKGRFDNMREVVVAIDDALSVRTRDEWGVIFDEHGLVWGPVLGLHEVVRDPQAEHLGLFPTIDDPIAGPYPTVAVPLRIRDAEIGPQGRSPDIGEHTRSVLGGAGYSSDEIGALFDAGAVGEP
ncbi:MAG: CoA transferase [Acidimicrobiia bacterium]|nr:CoA transferase [Acidimicrobiia bacterium]